MLLVHIRYAYNHTAILFANENLLIFHNIMNEESAKVIRRTISLSAKLDIELRDYANEYFAGNISACIAHCFLAVKKDAAIIIKGKDDQIKINEINAPIIGSKIKQRNK